MDAEDARKWAQRLSEAAETRMPIEPITSQIPGLSVRDAYTIQTEWSHNTGAHQDSISCRSKRSWRLKNDWRVLLAEFSTTAAGCGAVWRAYP